jgi:hypothetical protein
MLKNDFIHRCHFKDEKIIVFRYIDWKKGLNYSNKNLIGH